MTRSEIKAKQRYLLKESKKWPAHLVPVPPEDWPEDRPKNLETVWRSAAFLVQVCADTPTLRRVSVMRARVRDDGEWDDQLTWDELMEIKRQVGFGDYDAVEVYPRDIDVVNVANMRHLWVVDGMIPFAWRNPMAEADRAHREKHKEEPSVIVAP